MRILINTPLEDSDKLSLFHGKTVSVVLMKGDSIHSVTISMLILLHNLHELPYNTNVVYNYTFKLKEAVANCMKGGGDRLFFPITIGFEEGYK